LNVLILKKKSIC